ncbi:Protein STICHEL-like 1 [Cardamine amara subsp. amara]|uniref:Protein STICHEL-like 1 n=1 Tax=Cardamine amara subsp. amara TaxID=228776 RepID=A0ABD1AA01_CARAN
MSSLRISDPSKLHLKRELTQIRKVAKGLRDPGTTSSWKSPLTSSRSVAETVETPPASKNVEILSKNQLDSQFPSSRGFGNEKEKEKKVFLYNWKTHKTPSDKSGFSKHSETEDGTSWIQGSLNDNDDDDDVSDARNGGETRSASMVFRSRDTSLVSPGFSKIRNSGFSKKKGRYHQPKEASLGVRNSAKSRKFPSNHLHAASGLSVVRDEETDELSDETEDFSNSEKPRKINKVSSPLLMKLKNKNWSRSSSKLLRATSKKEDSSYTCNSTPALSTSSYNMYAIRNPSTVGSWEDGDDELDDDNLGFTGRQGCGIPFYWTKRNMKHRGGCRSCCSPSFSDTLRKTGSSILCGSQSAYRRHRHSSGRYDKQKLASRSAKGVLPLLKYGGDSRGGGSSIGIGCSDDDLSTDFGELDLEAQSRLDGRRWSTCCRSQGGLDGEGEEEEEEGSTPESSIQSLSQKYKPMFFDELIGQSIVVQSLMNAVKKGRIAHVYLFQGPRGTGKTSTARIFSAALNCDVTTEVMKPCGYCKECSDFMLGKSRDLLKLDAGKKSGAEKVRYLLKKLLTLAPQSSPRFKVFVIYECHLLPSKTWLSLLKFLENPLQKVVFICITSDLDNVPRTIQSRCQKYIFNKLRDGDIVVRLRKIASDENLDVESQAFDLIALNSDGSLRDAETMLEQLSLMGKRITVDLVNELVGVVSDDKLLEILELAFSSDTAETVKKVRELLDLGADPILMMSQLASLIMDIIAGAYKALDEKYSDAFLDGRNLTEADLERLKRALKLLSEAEKQLRVSTDRSTWFIATLLQLGSMSSPGTTHTGSSRRQSSGATEENLSSISREVIAYKQRSGLQRSNSPSPTSMRKSGNPVHEMKLPSSSSEGLESDTSIASHDDTTASTMTLTCRNSEKLDDIWIKCVDRCHSKTLKQLLYAHGKLISISEVEGILVAYIAFGEREVKLRAERFLSSITNSIEMVLRRNVEVRIILLSETELLNSKQTRKSTVTTSSDIESGNEIPMKRIEAIIQEQRLETEWLQRTPGSQGRLKPERNQILPQEDTNGVKVLKICEFQENKTGKRMEHCPVSPSLLHNSNFTNNKDNLEYESGTGRGVCSLLFCWNTQKSPRRSKIKGTSVRSRRRSRERRFSLFSGCARPRA